MTAPASAPSGDPVATGSRTTSTFRDATWIRAALLALATLGGILITWASHRRYWFPHDEGTLAQAALRVVEGQVPHRDFTHPYTGADAAIHALWFKLSGISLGSIRLGFFVLVAGWLIAMGLWVWSRTSSRWAVVGLLVLAAFGPAMYPGAVPSWYVSMLVCGAVALLTPNAPFPSRHAFIAAGALLGVAAGFKVTALYALGGVVLWVIGEGEGGRGRPWAILAVCAAALGVLGVLWPGAGWRAWVFVGLPATAVVLWAGVREAGRVRGEGLAWGWATMRPILHLAVGFSLGIAPMLVWLGVTGALPAFLESLIGVADARVAFAGFLPPRIGVLGWGGVVVLVGVAASAQRLPHVITILAVLVLLFVLTWSDILWHRTLWYALRGGLPLGIALAAMAAGRRPHRGWMPVALAVLGMMSLSQFPFASPIYFVYLAPLAVMAVLSLPSPSHSGRRMLGLVGLWLAAVGVLQVVPAQPDAIGYARAHVPPLARLPGPRGGLMVSAEDAASFTQLHALVSDSIGPGAIWAGPDSPEVAFLTERRDVNTDPFAFLGSETPVEESLFRDEVVAVIVRPLPPFSRPLSDDTVERLGSWFTRQTVVGPFMVFWERAR